MEVSAFLEKYFPFLDNQQHEQLKKLQPLYNDWNSKINVISRKDMDNFFIHHVLHSLAIAKVIRFRPSTSILDVGTGGGFPGIPLAIAFPESNFLLVDSIGKKIKVVEEVAGELGLKNIKAMKTRAEELKGSFDFIVSRAVTTLPVFLGWIKGKIKADSLNEIPNGVLYLKGGDLSQELENIKMKYNIFEIASFFEEPFFETKKIVHLYAASVEKKGFKAKKW